MDKEIRHHNTRTKGQGVKTLVTSPISETVHQEKKNKSVAQKTHSQNTTEDSSLQDYVVQMGM